MHKLIVLFSHPPDIAKFEDRWSHDFVRLAERMPGLRRVAVSHLDGGPAGPVPYYLIHEFYFDDRESMVAAMASREGAAAANALMSFAAEFVTLMFAEHMQETRGNRQGEPVAG